MKTAFLLIALEIVILACCAAEDPRKGKVSEASKLKITILYDNTAVSETFKPDWGFACYVEGMDKTILFDAGTQPDVLDHNMKQAHIDRDGIQLLAISHTHGDHTGGVVQMAGGRKMEAVYLPHELPAALTASLEKAKLKTIVVTSPLELFPHAHLTGSIGTAIAEQSMILDTPRGLVLITGCSHPGIVSIVRKAKEVLGKEVYLVLGGFHLLNHTDEQIAEIVGAFKSLGVQYCGASHCTGEKAIAAFRKAYGEHFVELGAGRVVTMAEDGSLLPGG